jgi:putative addiction module component (TIGR02574 family)
MSVAYTELFNLPVAEKLRLLGDLWDSIAADPEQVPVPDGLIEELDRSKAEYQKDPGIGRSWDEVRESIRAKHG